MITWSRVSSRSRVKPSFPRTLFSRDAEDTGNERESKHGDGSLQFCYDYKLVLVPKPRLIWRLWYHFPLEAYFFLVWLDLSARRMSVTATEHWNEDHVLCSSDTDNNMANYSAKRRVSKGKLKTNAAVSLKMFIYWCVFFPK